MKKTLTVLAVMAIAAAAYAEISSTKLGAWAFTASTSDTPADYKVGDTTAVSFTELTRVGGLEINGSSANFNSKTWLGAQTNDNVVTKAGITFDVTVASGFEVANSGLVAGGVCSSGASGPKYLEWRLGGDNGTIIDTWTLTASGATKELDIGAKLGTLSAGTYTFKELATGTEAPSGTLANGGSSRMTSLEFRGDVSEASAVPEPATMSLLGLGALAMVLRRKLRK